MFFSVTLCPSQVKKINKSLEYMTNYPDNEKLARTPYCAPWAREIAIKCDVSFLVSWFFDDEEIEKTDEEELF